MIVGSGVDVVEIARIERALTRPGDRFARRVFAQAEIAACRKFRRPSPHFALRFAVKEAVMKALGTGWANGVRWVDIETVEQPASVTRPRLVLQFHGRTRELVDELGASRRHLAVSRTRSHAIALVVFEKAHL
ncbi:MAG: holo-ACP synthase [Myxococcota bacterium]